MSIALSVLVPVYNTAAYLADALASISSQTFGDFELIVVDDGSSDGSTEILRRHARHEPRARVIVRENRGLIETRNELLHAASAPLVAWMDSDDVALPQRFALQVQRFREQADLVGLGGAAVWMDPEGWPVTTETCPVDPALVLAQLQRGGGFRFPTLMMRREAALTAGGFRDPFVVGEDLDLLLRMSEAGSIANLPEVVLHYRLHPRSTSILHGGHRWLPYRDTILELARERRRDGSDRLQRGEPVALPAPESAFVSRAEHHIDWARLALASGHRKTAWKHALQAARVAPGELGAWKTVARVALGHRPPREPS